MRYMRTDGANDAPIGEIRRSVVHVVAVDDEMNAEAGFFRLSAELRQKR
jgi:hypothetical protein